MILTELCYVSLTVEIACVSIHSPSLFWTVTVPGGWSQRLWNNVGTITVGQGSDGKHNQQLCLDCAATKEYDGCFCQRQEQV